MIPNFHVQLLVCSKEFSGAICHALFQLRLSFAQRHVSRLNFFEHAVEAIRQFSQFVIRLLCHTDRVFLFYRHHARGVGKILDGRRDEALQPYSQQVAHTCRDKQDTDRHNRTAP